MARTMRTYCFQTYNPVTLCQKEDMCVSLENTNSHRIAEASPHDTLQGIGRIDCDPRAVFPSSYGGLDLLGHALEHALENSARTTLATFDQRHWSQGMVIPDTLFSRSIISPPLPRKASNKRPTHVA